MRAAYAYMVAKFMFKFHADHLAATSSKSHTICHAVRIECESLLNKVKKNTQTYKKIIRNISSIIFAPRL